MDDRNANKGVMMFGIQHLITDLESLGFTQVVRQFASYIYVQV